MKVQQLTMQFLKRYFQDVQKKEQVSVVYEGRKPISVDSVVMSIQHAPDMELTVLRVLIEEMVMCPDNIVTGKQIGRAHV